MNKLIYRNFYTSHQSCFEVSRFQLRDRKKDSLESNSFIVTLKKVCSEPQRTKQNHRERRERERDILDGETRRWRVSLTEANEFPGGASLVVAMAARPRVLGTSR